MALLTQTKGLHLGNCFSLFVCNSSRQYLLGSQWHNLAGSTAWTPALALSLNFASQSPRGGLWTLSALGEGQCGLTWMVCRERCPCLGAVLQSLWCGGGEDEALTDRL